MKAIFSLILIILVGSSVLGYTIKSLSVADMEVQKAQEQIRTLQLALSKSQSDLEAAIQKLAAAVVDRDKAMETIKGLTSLVEELRNNLQTLQKDNAALRQRVSELEQAQQSPEAKNEACVAQGALLGPQSSWALVVPALLLAVVAVGYSGLRLMGKFETLPNILALIASRDSRNDIVSVRMPRKRMAKYIRWLRQVQTEERISVIENKLPNKTARRVIVSK